MAKRSVFEEVGERRAAPAPRPARAPARGAIAAWLWLLAALVAVMVLVGGATRLTDSGLSITEWAPVMGVVPPLSDADWEAAFAAYQQTTEFQKQNSWMTLEDFRPIFWWEWVHRFLGRAIGVVWLTGFAGFLIARAVPPGWTGRLVLPAGLGALQGAVGWWMVVSGLSGRLDVAPYRLMAHLGLAFAIFVLLVWLALRVRPDEVATLAARRRRIGRVMTWTTWLGALAFVQILSGALVAGLDAGRGYVDWPRMEGNWIPPESFDLSPVWVNAFQNPALAQFDHRIIGYLLLAVTAVFVWQGMRTRHRAVRRWVAITGAAILAQAVIGVTALMHASPLGLALLHQAGALAVTFLIVRTRFAAGYPPEQRIERLAA
ncbi:MAG TPA: COX15/CtaA family protein [Paracoccaceae bacterium]|nr:COX15/CtaA family protein [Paracoccaceae bacterium]